jgi:hypothetical protein
MIHRILRFFPLLPCVVALGCSDLGDPVKVLPECVVSTTMIDFGEVTVGTSFDHSFSISNEGGGILSGNVTSSCIEFSVISGAVYSIESGGTHTVTLRYTPPDSGASVCSISTGSACDSVTVMGVGGIPTIGAECRVEPLSLDFGIVDVGMSADRDFLIINDGLISFGGIVTETCADYDVIDGSGSFTIMPGGTLSVTIRFAPLSGGIKNCTIATGVNCGDVDATGSSFTVSYGADVQPIYTARCTTVGCHVGRTPIAGMDLSAGASYGETVNMTSAGYAPARIVVPFSTSGSVLYQKIIDSSNFGGKMPPNGAPLNAAQQDIIRRWIEEGANNN